jgi:basic membrane protein A
LARNRWAASFLALGVTAVVASGCGSSGDGSSTGSTGASTGAAEKQLKIGYQVSGNLGNKDFYDSAMKGLEAAKAKTGAELTVVEGGPDNPTGWEQQLQQLSQVGMDAIVFTPSNDPDGLKAVVQKNPDQKFITFDAPIDLPNAENLTYASNEGGYLAGVLAALVTEGKSKDFPKANDDLAVGFMTGLKLPATEDFRIGFTQGVHSVNPDIEVKSAIIGSFADQTKAYNLASALYDDGVDVIYSEAGSAQTGIAKAAKDKDKYVIGGTVNINDLYPGHTIASDLKDVGTSVQLAVERLAKGEFKGGTVQTFGAGVPGGMTIAFDENVVPESIRAQVDKAAKQIASGEIKVDSSTTGSGS